MKNILLILIMLITGITNAQDCPEWADSCPPPSTDVEPVFNFECGPVDYSSEISEIEEIVALFFTELEYYNDAYVNFGGVFDQEAYDLKQKNIGLYPYDGIVAEDYTVDIDFYPFTGSTSIQGANANICNGNIINIEVNSDKWFTEITNLELKSDGTEYEDNKGNPVLVRLKKKFVIYHELGHAVLNLDHNCDAEIDEYADIMKSSQCPRGNGSQYDLSFPFDFPVFQDNDFDNATKECGSMMIK